MSDKLSRYRAKRTAEATPEPLAQTATGAGASRFVVQKHAATREHYDLRLEHDGVLLSWAVPKGPSLDPADKRMAVHVEDHPVEYIDFEGVIPEKNYGAGEVIVWDKGSYRALEDFSAGMKSGKLLFELTGYKLRGVFTLVRIKKSEKDWLLIKHKDAWATTDGSLDEASVLSGLTIEELRDGPARVGEVLEALAAAGAPQRALGARDVELMLAETRDEAFSDPAWLFEIKFDGFRMLAERADDQVRLQYRRGSDAAALYPDLVLAMSRLPCRRVVFDAEVVVDDDHGRPSFQRLQKRALLSRRLDIARAAVESPAVLHVFDLLAFEGYDVRGLPLVERKALLQKLVPARGPVRYVDHLEETGREAYEAAQQMRLEGLMAKRKESRYRGGRSPDWLKLRVEQTGDFAVVGATAPKGSRVGAGALHLAYRDGDTWRYIGAVGSGFTDAQLASTKSELDSHRVKGLDLAGAQPRGRDHSWAEPTLVAEVRYHEMTEEGLLRKPVFLRFRSDKHVLECVEPPVGRAGSDEPPAPVAAIEADRTVKLTNTDKTYWPAEKYTKGDLLVYYREIAPWLLPYLRDRPVMLTRYPDGIDGKSFFQKDAPEWTPDWIRTEALWSQDTQRDIHYFILEDVESLLYVANMGSIPLHIWGSRIATLEHPDWCILDLDPKTAPFSDVLKIARVARTLCDEIGLPSFVKTSGGSGMHVLIPLAQLFTYDQCRQLGQLLAGVIVSRVPAIATVERTLAARGGRVYVDFLQNGMGKTLAAAFSARPVPGARVSMPLKWNEVTARLDPSRFTIKTALARMNKLGGDPFAPVLTTTPDLPAALAALHGLLERAPR